MTIKRTAVAQQLGLELQVKLFNARFIPGDSILYIPEPGLPPEWDRLYSHARLEGETIVVDLAGRTGAVPIRTIHTMPIETTHVRAPYSQAPVWALVTAFVLGFAVSVLIGLLIAPAQAVAPEHIVIECEEPGEFAAIEEDVA